MLSFFCVHLGGPAVDTQTDTKINNYFSNSGSVSVLFEDYNFCKITDLEKYSKRKYFFHRQTHR